ncbi:MAG: FliM/FliN family flagellar motor switch protein [Sphingobium sp.]
MSDVQSFRFGQTEPQAPLVPSGVDKLGERLARRLRTILEPMVGGKPTVTPLPSEMVTYGQWSAMAASFSAYSIYRLHPLKGGIMVRIDAALVGGMLERFYGGAGGKAGLARSEFTPSEERIIARVSDAIMDALIANWGEAMHLESVMKVRETDPRALSFAETTDQMLSQSFTVCLSRNEEWPIELMLPLVALRQLEPLLSSGTAEEGRLPDPIWRTRIAQQMGNIRLPAKTVLARPTLNLTELLALKPGDVIPVNIQRALPLIVNNRVLAQGTIGEQNGRAAFMIEKLS